MTPPRPCRGVRESPRLCTIAAQENRMTTTVPVEINQAIHDAISACADELITTSRAIHALEQPGFEGERGVPGMPTAFVARHGHSGPHVAFVCEYDALRGLGHACGHNLIATSSAGAGVALARALRGPGGEAPL